MRRPTPSARPATTARPRRHRAVAAPAVIAAGLLLAGCAGGGADEERESAAPATVTVTQSPEADETTAPSPSSSSPSTSSAAAPSSSTPTASTSSTSSSAASATGTEDLTAEQRERLDVLDAVLLTPEDAPEVLTDSQTQQGGGEEITTSLTLTGVTPTGECRELIERINTQSAQGVGGTVASYTVAEEARSGVLADQGGAFAMAALTRDDADIVAPFGELPDTCGTVGDPQGGPQAVFTPVPGVADAAQVEMSLGEDSPSMFTMVVGGASDGTEHVYMGLVGVDPDLAVEVLQDQVAAFEGRSR